MRTRPLGILILALIQAITPLSHILIISILGRIPPGAFLSILLSQPMGLVVGFFALYPLSGLAFYLMKKWSYFVSLGATVAAFSVDFQIWKTLPGVTSPAMTLALYLLNVAIISYLAIPSVREGFFNAALRWWERKPRFALEGDATLQAGDTEFKGIIRNVSEGGLFVEVHELLGLATPIRIRFRFGNSDFDLQARIMRARSVYPSSYGYGIQFISADPKIRAQLKQILKGAEKAGLAPVKSDESAIGDFFNWGKKKT